jgi:hypothetical protein
MKRNFIYTIQTNAGFTFNIEAASREEAEIRAKSPVITRAIAQMLSQALSNIKSVEMHRGPERLAQNKLTFKNEMF